MKRILNNKGIGLYLFLVELYNLSFYDNIINNFWGGLIMLVYRTVSSIELLGLINDVDTSNINTIRGQNTFNYEKGITYIHFFKFQEHALYYMKKRNDIVIIKYDIPDDLLGNVEYGFYGDVDTYYDDTLYGYYMPLPEYAMNKEYFKKEYIVDFSYNGVWKNPKNYTDVHDFFLSRKKSFI